MAEDCLFFSQSATPAEAMCRLEYRESSGVCAKYFSAPVVETFKVLLPPRQLSASVSEVWAAIFSTSSSFFADYKTQRNETELELPPWEMVPDRSAGYRMMRNITVVDKPLPNTRTRFLEAQRFGAHAKANGALQLVLQLSAQTPDVISGTSFRVETLIVFESAGADQPTTVTFYGHVMKVSNAFLAIKLIAVPRALSELKKSYEHFLKLAEARCGAVQRPVALPEPEAPVAAPIATPPESPAQPKAAAWGALGLVGAVAAGILLTAYNASSTLSALERSVELQNRRWSYLQQNGGDQAVRGAPTSPAPPPADVAAGAIPPWARILVAELADAQQTASTTRWLVTVQFVLLGLVILWTALK